MPILVMCSNPKCGELFDVPDDAGGEVRCPSCGTVQPTTGGPHRPTGEPAAPPRRVPASGGRSWIEEIESTPEAAEAPVGAGGSAAPAGGIPLAGEGARKPAEGDAETPGLLDDSHFLLADDWTHPAPTPEPDADAVLDHSLAAPTITGLGLLGIAAGLGVGLTHFPEQPLLSAYVGAALGWVAGFVFAFLLLLAAHTDEAPIVRCAVCLNLLPADVETCRFCGSALAGQQVPSLAADCLKAGGYGLSNLSTVYFMVAILSVGNLLFAGTFHLLREWPWLGQAARRTAIVLCAIVGFWLLGHWLRLLLSAVGQTLLRSEKAPDIPGFWSLGNIATGVKSLCVLAVYVLPIVTMPLLPLGLLALATPGRRRAFGLGGAMRSAWRHFKDLAVLWLLLLLWGAGTALAVVLVVVGFRRAAGLVPPLDAVSRITLSIVLSTVETGILGAIACIFGLAIFRCIGLFALYNAAALFAHEQPPDRA